MAVVSTFTSLVITVLTDLVNPVSTSPLISVPLAVDLSINLMCLMYTMKNNFRHKNADDKDNQQGP